MEIKSLFPTILLGLCIACSNPSASNKNEVPEKLANEQQLPDTVAAVCIWNNISVRETPSGKGKYVTAISLGEELRSTQIVEVDSLADDRKYVRVILADGSSGWSLEDFIVAEASAGAIKEATDIFERPDLLTKTDDHFSQMDIVAIKEQKDAWVLVEGKRTGAKWLSEGWVKATKISTEKTDIALSKFMLEALSKEKKKDQKEAMNAILEMEEFYNSIFYATAEQLYLDMFE